MPVTDEDLRLELDEQDWTAADQVRATEILRRCRTRILAYVGSGAYEAAEAAEDEAALDLVDDITVSYAARRWANPEQTLQRRQGADYSVSFADGSEAASGLTKAERAALDDAFGRHGPGAMVSAWNSSELAGSWYPRVDLG